MMLRRQSVIKPIVLSYGLTEIVSRPTLPFVVTQTDMIIPIQQLKHIPNIQCISLLADQCSSLLTFLSGGCTPLTQAYGSDMSEVNNSK